MSKIIIIGAGPAGLSAGYFITKNQNNPAEVTILEQESAVGGLAKTIVYKDYLFDIGGHRFFTTIDQIKKIWFEIFGNNFLTKTRLSRIYYQNKFLEYPLVFSNVITNLGISESIKIIFSFLFSQFIHKTKENNFKEYITRKFGNRLFEIFFKNYTEKIWGLDCSKISDDWAKERIKGLSMKTAIFSLLFPNKNHKIKTLSKNFLYPPKGPGQFYEKMEETFNLSGGIINKNEMATKIFHNGKKILKVETIDKKGNKKLWELNYLISSMPITELVFSLEPQAPQEILTTAKTLKYRDFLVVNIICDNKDIFPDHWLYINTSFIKLGRIQNYKNWSEIMVPDPTKTSLGLEYFCSESEPIWQMDDKKLIEKASLELEKIGFKVKVLDGFVYRQKKAYPVYEVNYKKNLNKIKEYLNNFENLSLIGRNGRFQYDNMDIAMVSGIKEAQKALNYLQATQ